MKNEKNDELSNVEKIGMSCFLIAAFLLLVKGYPYLQKHFIVKDAITINYNQLWFIVSFLFEGISFIGLYLSILSIKQNPEKQFSFGFLSVFLLGNLLLFSIFSYTSPSGQYSNFMWIKSEITWEKVKEVQLDVYRPAKGAPRLVYKIKSINGRVIDLNSNKIYGSLEQLDQMLIKRNMMFNIRKLKQNPSVDDLIYENKVVAQRHLRGR